MGLSLEEVEVGLQASKQPYLIEIHYIVTGNFDKKTEYYQDLDFYK